MLEKVKEFFEKQYVDTARAIEFGWGTPKDFVSRAITDCLAVALFAQTIGVKFKEVDPLYEEYKEKLESLLTD